MRTVKLMQSLSWTAASALVTLLIVACAQVMEAPDQTAARGSADSESDVVTAERRDPATAVGEGNEGAEQLRQPSAGSSPDSARIVQPASPPDADTLILGGARIVRDDSGSAGAATASPEDEVLSGTSTIDEVVDLIASGQATGQQQYRERVGQFEQQQALRSRSALNFYRGNGPGAAGELGDAPLSRVQPGEEVWVISRESVPATTAESVADDALGSGVMIARYTPAVLDDTVPPTPQPVREIPLPLKHTDVSALIQGYVGTVDVTQEFENPYDSKIEAVYMFPLPEKSAVSEFVMTIGERRIRGILREKEQAQAIYNQARAQGYQASLLVQHRPNVFEQKVANIEPGKQIDVNIRYFQTLAYADGWYSFVFPTVVGPRYNPPGSKDPLLAVPQNELAPTPDSAVRYLTPGTVSAHDISIAVELDAGVAIEEIASSHKLSTVFGDNDTVSIELADGEVVPNRDFLLRFRVAGDRIKSNLLTYVDEESGEGYFTLMMYPPANLERLRRQPLELVFVLDTSGSMSGAPIEQAKDAIIAALDRLEPHDTFQIIRFSQSTSQFGRRPVAATRENIADARRYVRALSGSGGTEMIEGIRAALNFPHDDQRLRFVTFLTDGFIGNESDILDEIDFGLDASRIFSFGVGSAPNRYLLERMAGIGRGAVAWLSLEDSGSEVMDAFFDRIAHPAMIDVEIDWGRMNVAEVFPRRMPDLFVGRPVILTGKFSGEPDDVRMNGRAANERVSVRLNHEDSAPEHEFLPNLWARLKIADLNDALAVNPQRLTALSREIRETALAYNLMSDFTSFIAVDASQITDGGYGTTVFQGVPVPQGVRYDTTVGR